MKPIKAKPAERPPKNALRVRAWRDLPPDRKAARYTVKRPDEKAKVVTVSKGPRVMLDALIKQPVYCASIVRISECVSVLRHDYGIPIEAVMYDNDKATDRARFGVYHLKADVQPVEGGAT